MFKKLLFAISLVLSIIGFSQTTLSNSYQPPQIVADGTVRMIPGFHANSNDGNYINGESFRAIIGDPLTQSTPPKVVHTPSSGENYVYSRTYLAPVTSSNPYAPQVQNILYFDGMGRPKQSIAIKASTSGNDLVVPSIYDDYGRKTKNYLPISRSSLNGAIQGNIDEAIVNNYYGSTNAFSENEFESVSFGRLKQSAFPGDDWIKNGGNTVRQEYDINNNTDGVIKKYTTTATWDNTTKMYTSSIPSVSSYGAGELYKFKIIDEDENEKYVFKDKLGRIILSRKNDGSNFIDTYNVYNDYGQLSYIIPPLASVKATLTTPVLNALCYQYRYDERNRLVEKKLPGKGLDISTGIWGWEYMIYDNQDRVVMIQDATLGKNKEWIFTKYDQFGRKAYTGIYTSLQAYNSTGRYFEQDQINGKGNNNVARTTSNFVQPGLLVYYDNDATKNYPNSITKLLTVNYYDTYPADKPNLTTLGFTQTLISDIATTNINTKGLLLATYVNNVESNGWTKSFAWYDNKGRSVASYTKNFLGHYTQTESFLDFAGVIQKTITKHRRTSTDAELVINDDFIYDNQNRLKKHFHEVVGKTPKELLAEYSYDEIGQLTEKKVGADQYGNNPIQTINYSYNIRGWNTGINLDTSGNFQAGKLFNYKINYNNTLEITNTKPDVSNQALEVKKKFNGNIAEVTWQYGGVPSPEVKKYGYVYDGLDRLRAGFYYQKSGSSYLFTEEHNELSEYDLNGNITNLKRFAYKIGNLPNKIDDLTYSYIGGNGNSNTLLSVTDSGNASGYEGGGSQISYDSNGNMTVMPDKGITISYNYLDLPTNISRGAKNISEYKYRADGTKIKKTTTFINKMGTSIINTEYFGGFQYSTPNTDPLSKALNVKDDATMELTTAGEEDAFTRDLERAIVVDPGNPSVDNMVLSFFPTSEGYYDFENLRYIYQYKDQVGNIRVSYTKDSSTGLAKSLDQNDYYPFGMSHLKSTLAIYDPMSVPYNYKFQEQELQETGFYSFKWRQYMPDLGRFFNADPLSEKYSYQSHYNFSENRIINSREIEGLEAFDNYDDAHDFGDRQGLSDLDFYVEINDGKYDVVQNIEEVIVTKETDFIEGFIDEVNEFIDEMFDNEEIFPFFYTEGLGRDYEGMGDDLLRDGDRVEAINLDEFVKIKPGGIPGDRPGERFDSFGEFIDKMADALQTLDSESKKETIPLKVEYDFKYNDEKNYVESRDTIIEVEAYPESINYHDDLRQKGDSLREILEK